MSKYLTPYPFTERRASTTEFLSSIAQAIGGICRFLLRIFVLNVAASNVP